MTMLELRQSASNSGSANIFVLDLLSTLPAHLTEILPHKGKPPGHPETAGDLSHAI